MFYCGTRISAGNAWGGELTPEWDKFVEMAGTFCYNHKYAAITKHLEYGIFHLDLRRSEAAAWRLA